MAVLWHMLLPVDASCKNSPEIMPIVTTPTWVDQPETLTTLCERWRRQGAIAIDTEFMRSDTFYPIAGLIQVGDGQGCYLIDPLAFEDLSAFTAVLTDPAITKVLHACSEDLEVFQTLLAAVPAPVFDTQVGAAFAGYGYSLGYAALVQATLGIDIPKGETRSDWLQRPLSLAQREYAALDVAHLLVIYGKLRQQLKASQRLAWVREDCAALVATAQLEPEPDLAYCKVGFAWKLDGVGRAVLQGLCRWREFEARACDLPRNRLMKEAQLFEIARRQPDELHLLQRIEGLPKRTLNDYGEILLDIVANAQRLPPSAWPEAVPLPLHRRHGALIKQLKAYVREQAQQHDLPPEVLIRKKEYEQLLRSALEETQLRLPPRLKGWRYDIIGQGLLQEMVAAGPLAGEDK